MDVRIDDAVRHAYRSAFTQAVADGRAKPLLLPYSLLGAPVLLILWLTIPHTRRPWLYQTRWLVLAFIIAFNWHVARESSSTNMACSYAAGLHAAWGIILSVDLLVWKRPQFEAARAVRVLAVEPIEHVHANGSATAAEPESWKQNGLRRRTNDKSASLQDEPQAYPSGDRFVWQTFPADAPFWDRLGWAWDLASSFRGSGWNYSISSLPRPRIPSVVRSGEPVNLQSMPLVTGSGYRRHVSEAAFTLDRLSKVAILYLMLDFLSVSMMKDPYFILGPDHAYDLPPRLARLPRWLLLLYREVLSLGGFLSAIGAIFSLADLVQYWSLKALCPSRSALWFYSSTFGSLNAVLDRGLAGWWGDWWHQTFRQQFMGPSTYLLQHGYLEKGSTTAKIVTMFVSFAQSGFLHAFGSMTTIPATKLWRSPAFFLLQGVGMLTQEKLASLAKAHFPSPSRGLVRVTNATFTIAWMYATAWLFIDDIASTGLWMLEPVPISPLRWMGYGHPSDHWLRWDWDLLPKWHVGRHWWETGLAL
ncbi:membrane bound o-acyl transferase family domain-containing protein [Purpureocillium lavendulum]|uniref:Membrane bound o-acyl transferase family domain-containing protein n=1 Tax=Purpureocillium lavendulum TaxID=1247861 RepID=A0AB34G4L4_9HYPO|nr:membrane bound o-acyl transferase family domain-containing protein [Purpureocillium lavendulum]